MDSATLYLEDGGHLDTLQTLMRVSATLSLIGTVSVMTHMVRNWKDLSGLPHRIVLWWTMADMVLIPAALMGRLVIDSPIGCSIQGVLVQYGLATSVLWGAVMATNVLLSVVFHVPNSRLLSLEKYYHALAWLVPLLATAVPLMVPLTPDVPLLGDSQLWCWIRKEHSWLRMALLYGPAMAVFVYSLAVYAIVGFRVWRTTGNKAIWRASNTPSNVRQKYALKTSLYILAFMLTWVFGLVNRVRTLIMPSATPSYPIFALQAAFMSAQGFLNALAYFAPLVCMPLLRRLNLYTTTTTSSADDKPSSAQRSQAAPFSRYTVLATTSTGQLKPTADSGVLA
ncbi:hypothetical protein RI367_005761 [Sorochytrium milnesiophthora]